MPWNVTQFDADGLINDHRLKKTKGTPSTDVSTTSGTVLTSASVALQVRQTPHQLALSQDNDTFSTSYTATVRYTVDGDNDWSDAHPLYRVRPGEAEDAFSGCIFDLEPGTTYDVEITYTDGVTPVVRDKDDHGTFTTRALPAGVSQDTPNETPETLGDLQTAINGASAGDVIELQDGTYSLSTTLTVSVDGTEANPIYIRGESKAGTVIECNENVAFRIWGDHIVIENMTIDGEFATDDVTYRGGIVIATNGPDTTQEYITVRDCVIQNFPIAIITSGGSTGGYSHNCLVYNNTLSGTLAWTSNNLTTSIGWNNDGVRLVGHGNCVWNNTMDGFGDAITFAHSEDEASGVIECNYAYRNYIRNSINDAFELDHCERFTGVYDNYCENVDTGVSQSDNSTTLNYGPSYVFRNIFANIAVKWTKLNTQWEGWHWYNNTFIQTKGVPGDNQVDDGFYSDAGDSWQERWAYRNNIHLLTAASPNNLFEVRWVGYSPNTPDFDVSHNAWYPTDESINWKDDGPNFANYAAAKASTTTHSVLYPSAAGLSPSTYYHEHDVSTDSNPFVNSPGLGATAITELSGKTSLELDSGNAKNAGVEIPGITTGYSGAAPDMGAVIEGRSAVVYGVSALASAADALSAGQSVDLDNNSLASTTEPGVQWQTVSLFYDSVRRKIHYMGKPASGTVPPKSEDYTHYVYDELTDTWTEPNTNPVDTPFGGHVWNVTFDPANGDYYHRIYATNYIRKYTGSTQAWSTSSTEPANRLTSGGTPNLAAAVWHPNLFGAGVGGVLCWNAVNVTAWKPNDTWYHLDSIGSGDGDYYVRYGGQGLYLPATDQVIIFARSTDPGDNGNAILVDAGAGNSTSIISEGYTSLAADPPIPVYGGGTSNTGHVVNHPDDTNRLLCLEEYGTRRVWDSTDYGSTWNLKGYVHPFGNPSSGQVGEEFTCGTIARHGIIMSITSHSTGEQVEIWKPGD